MILYNRDLLPLGKGDNPGGINRRLSVNKASSSFVKGGAEADLKKELL